MPLLAKARHNRHLLAAWYRFASAWMKASRADRTAQRAMISIIERLWRSNGLTCRVARLQLETINKEMEPHHITSRAVRISPCIQIEAICIHQIRLDLVQHVRPHLANIMNLRPPRQTRVPKRVRHHVCGVGVFAQAAGCVPHVAADDVVCDGSGGLGGPVCYGV